MEFQGKDEGRPLIGWCLELNFTEVLIGPRWVKSDPLGGPNSNVHSTPINQLLLLHLYDLYSALYSMIVIMLLLPSNPEICLDPDWKTKLFLIVCCCSRIVRVGAVDSQAYFQ